MKVPHFFSNDSHFIFSIFFFGSLWSGHIHMSYFWPLVPLFWISGNVSSGFQSGICLICIPDATEMYIPWDPPLVLHIANLWAISMVGQQFKIMIQTLTMCAEVLCAITVPCQLALYKILTSLYDSYAIVDDEGSYTGLKMIGINEEIFLFFFYFGEKIPIFLTIPITWQPGPILTGPHGPLII